MYFESLQFSKKTKILKTTQIGPKFKSVQKSLPKNLQSKNIQNYEIFDKIRKSYTLETRKKRKEKEKKKSVLSVKSVQNPY